MVPTNKENNFEIRVTDIEAKITDKTKAILIGYPANPTGAVLSRDQLLQIADLAQYYQLLVISKDAHWRRDQGDNSRSNIEHKNFLKLRKW